jgi:serine phosphatase RsbU (regulator of sigma subunit)/anti-sigma regulatory factor (Ser/Thr protein kinase)
VGSGGYGDRADDPGRGQSYAENLQRVTEAGLAYLDLDDLLAELLHRTTEILGADTAAILLVDPEGDKLVARAAKGLEEEVETGFELPIGTGFAGRVAATGQPVVIEDIERSTVEIVNPLLREKGVRSLLGVPLIVGRELIGVLHVGMLGTRSFKQEDAHLLQLVADRAALAIEHDRLAELQRMARMFQRSLLPPMLPEIPGVAIAARYLPGTSETAVGGDWYDTVPFADGRVGIVVGDVVGSGVGAAARMAELRNALRAYAIEELSPAEVISKVARFANFGGDESMATCVYATLEPGGYGVTIANAGHPPPLLISPDGQARYVEHGSGAPLGVGTSGVYRESTFSLEPGASLVLYTDGLIERRGRLLSEGQSELAAAALAAPLDPELLCDHLLDAVGVSEAPDDDVAMLAVRNLGVLEGGLELTVAALPERLAGVRGVMRQWLRDTEATPDDVAAILLAATEACANAIEHAYSPVDSTLELNGERRGSAVQLAIRDQGRWRPPRGVGRRGRGMDLMRTFMDEVDVSTDASGSTVRLIRKLGRSRR